MIMAWLFGIIFIVLFVILFLYLRRRRAELVAEEEARAQAFFELIHGEAHQGVAPEAAEANPSWEAGCFESAPSADAVQPAVPAIAFAPPPPVPQSMPMPAGDDGGGGPVYLDKPSLLIWRWLRTALPGHECFARGSLRRVVGRDRAKKDMLLDFVICDGACRVVAVVDLARRHQDAAVTRFKDDVLAEVGVRYACWDATQLPDRDFVQAWVAGEA